MKMFCAAVWSMGFHRLRFAAFPQESFIFLVRERQKLPGRRWRSFWMKMAGVSRGLFLMYLRIVISGFMRGFFWASINKKVKKPFTS